MQTDSEELNAIIATLKEGRTAEPTTIRTFLSWFGAQRRTTHNVSYIESQLAKGGVRTVPGYLNRWVDSPMTFELSSKESATSDSISPPVDRGTEVSSDDQIGPSDQALDDPSFRIGSIASARRPPVHVRPTATLQEAMTLMLARNFSQLPVMTSDRDVKGVISWTSIGTRLAANIDGINIQAYMTRHFEIDVSASLFSGIRIIAENDYVLVRDSSNLISGIVTANDIALQFEEISTPFLLLGEIESRLRALIAKKLSKSDIKKACKEEFLPADFNKVHELTFGNCVKVLEHPENWDKLNLGMDRKSFCRELSKINEIRNDVMHFNPDPITPENLARLRDSSRMFETLQSVGAF